MNSEKRFFICDVCKNLVGMIDNKGPKLSCCGKFMSEVIPNTVEASTEKHIPVVNIENDTVHVKVGSVAHPMVEEHFIGWVYMCSDKGVQRKALHINSDPCVDFKISSDEKVLEVCAYCNLHGLWKFEL